MRRLVLVLFVLAAMSLAPIRVNGSADCAWGDTIMTLAHIQAKVDAQEAGDTHALITEVERALQANRCFSS